MAVVGSGWWWGPCRSSSLSDCKRKCIYPDNGYLQISHMYWMGNFQIQINSTFLIHKRTPGDVAVCAWSRLTPQSSWLLSLFCSCWIFQLRQQPRIPSDICCRAEFVWFFQNIVGGEKNVALFANPWLHSQFCLMYICGVGIKSFHASAATSQKFVNHSKFTEHLSGQVPYVCYC